MIVVALVTTMPMKQKSVIVVGSPSACPHTCAFWSFAYRVKSGMFRLKVAQKPTIAVNCGTNTFQNSALSLNVEPWLKSFDVSPTFASAHHISASPATIRNGAAQLSSHLIELITFPMKYT